jgi:hypothetical protein
MQIRHTSSHSIELRSSLHGLVLLLSELVLEPFLLSRRRLTDLLELLFKVNDPLLLPRRILQQVSPALSQFCQRLSQYNKVVRIISITHNKVTNNALWTTHRQCGIDGNDASPQGLHVLVIFKPVLLPRGVIPVN